MQTGYTTNKAKEALAEELARSLPLTFEAASEIVERITALIDAGIGIQSHPGSPLTNQ